jgi:hypothetical protein
MRRRLVLAVLLTIGLLVGGLGMGACGGEADNAPTPGSGTTPQEVDDPSQSPVGEREVNDSEAPGPAGNPNPS